MRFRKIVVERVTVVKFRVDNRGSDGTGRFRIEVRTDTAEFHSGSFLTTHQHILGYTVSFALYMIFTRWTADNLK